MLVMNNFIKQFPLFTKQRRCPGENWHALCNDLETRTPRITAIRKRSNGAIGGPLHTESG